MLREWPGRLPEQVWTMLGPFLGRCSALFRGPKFARRITPDHLPSVSFRQWKIDPRTVLLTVDPKQTSTTQPMQPKRMMCTANQHSSGKHRSFRHMTLRSPEPTVPGRDKVLEEQT